MLQNTIVLSKTHRHCNVPYSRLNADHALYPLLSSKGNVSNNKVKQGEKREDWLPLVLILLLSCAFDGLCLLEFCLEHGTTNALLILS